MPEPWFAAPGKLARRCSLGLLIICASQVSAAAPAGGTDALAQAREAARKDRNAEAANLFREVLRRHPEKRGEVLREYADQLIYSSRSEQALPLLREILSWELTADERRTAQRSYALALLWSDQHRQALAAYDRVLSDQPDDQDARFNRVRALQWMGRPDRAETALAQLPESLRRSDKAAEIGSDIARSARPLTGIALSRTSQGDGLDLTSARVEHSFFPASGATRAGAWFEQRRFRDDGSSIRVDVPGVSGSARVSDGLHLSGSFALEWQRGSGVRRTQPVYEASAAFLPSDRLRFDLVTARRTLDNLNSLQRGITSRHYFASADYWPDPMLKLTMRGELTAFSDGNDRRWIQVQAERRIARSPNIFVGARATAFDFERQLDHGYFNPRSFRSGEATVRGWSKIGKATWLDLSASAGPEQSSPGGHKLAYSVRGKLSHALTDDLEASLLAERLSSGSESATGFSRNIVSAAIRLRW